MFYEDIVYTDSDRKAVKSKPYWEHRLGGFDFICCDNNRSCNCVNHEITSGDYVGVIFMLTVSLARARTEVILLLLYNTRLAGR